MIEDELRIRGLGDLGVRYRILIDTVISDRIFDVCWLIFFGESPIGDEIRVVIGIVAVHSQLLILELLKAVELCEKLEFFQIASERLRLVVIVGTDIDRIGEV